MTKNEKLQKILEGLSNSNLEDSFKLVEDEVKKLTQKLRDEAEIKTVDLAKRKIKEVKDQIQLLLDAFEKLKNDFNESEKKLSEFLNEKLGLFKNALDKVNSVSSERFQVSSDEISSLKAEIAEVSQRKIKIPDFNKQIQSIEIELRKAISELKESDVSKGFQNKFDDLEKDIKNLRSNAMSALANRGGSAHLQVNVNSSVASTRYADINFQQSGNIGWSAVNDDDLKRVNIRASILVSGGSGSGITRTVSVLSVSSTLAAAATTDYVYFANVGVRLTLPTAVGNSNGYVVKNMATSSVLVSAAAGQDIDGSATALMPTQYECLNFYSNGSVWGVV